MTQPDPTDQPATAAGRALLDLLDRHGVADDLDLDAQDILAIEREAVTAWLASPAAVEELAAALNDGSLDVTYYKRDLHGENLIPRSAAHLILQALRAARQEKDHD